MSKGMQRLLFGLLFILLNTGLTVYLVDKGGEVAAGVIGSSWIITTLIAQFYFRKSGETPTSGT